MPSKTRAARFHSMFSRLEGNIRAAKAAFRQVILHLNKNRIDLSPEDRAALKHLTEFWRGDPMRHNEPAFHDIKPFHRLNGREGSFKPLWEAYLMPLMEARCLMIAMAHEFPEVSVPKVP